MRKRRRLADKMTIMVCAVLIAFSAFFYAPMEVSAESSLVKRYDLTPGENYVATGYGIQSHVYCGGDIEYYDAANFFYMTLNGENLYYEDSVSIPIPFKNLNGYSIPFSGNKGRIYFNVGLSMNSVVNEPSDYPGLDLIFEQHVKDVYVVMNGQKYYGSRVSHNRTSNVYTYRFDFYFDVPADDYALTNANCSLVVDLENAITICGKDLDFNIGQFAHWTVHPSVVFSTYTGTVSDPQYSFYVYDLYSQDITDVDIELQTDEMLQSTEQQTDTLVNGFDNTQGDNVNSDLSAGLTEFQSAEDSLFATASSGLDDFSFFNFASIPAMVTGMSFVSSIMTSWFNQAGGASGVGIVLSILFSIMLVAMVLGLYRWYQSKGGKD